MHIHTEEHALKDISFEWPPAIYGHFALSGIFYFICILWKSVQCGTQLKMVPTIFGSKSLALTYFMYLKQGLHGPDFENACFGFQSMENKV